eukprot:m.119941 g.119941  ORF g.119941 m.119941 type:complete len:555 (+) comp28776_c0_seq1:380-2044(+)
MIPLRRVVLGGIVVALLGTVSVFVHLLGSAHDASENSALAGSAQRVAANGVDTSEQLVPLTREIKELKEQIILLTNQVSKSATPRENSHGDDSVTMEQLTAENELLKDQLKILKKQSDPTAKNNDPHALRQVVYARTKEEGLPIGSAVHPWTGHDWNSDKHNPASVHVHLLSPYNTDPTNGCSSVDVMFHQMKRGVCVMLVPDKYIQTKLFTVHMNQTTGNMVQQQPLLRKNIPLDNDVRDQRLVDFFKAKKEMVELIRDIVKADRAKRTELKTHPEALVVMCANKGHAGLLLNFACGLKKRNIPMPRHIIFSVSKEVHLSLTKLGFTSFYHPLFDAFHGTDGDAAKSYGDRTFGQMMMMKQYSVMLTLETGFDVLFQDVDFTWLTNPTDELMAQSTYYDMQFQDDGARGERYEPYHANSGFIYIRNCYNTLHFWDRVTLLMPSYPQGNQKVVAPELEHFVRKGVWKKDDFRIKILPKEKYVSGNRLAFDGSIPLSPHAMVMHFCWTHNITQKVVKMQKYHELHVSSDCLQNISSCFAMVGKDPLDWKTDVCVA